MNRIYQRILFLFFILATTAFPALAEQTKSVVVTTSMLESAVREVLPDTEEVEIIRLLPPSSCPGHFDLSPRVVPKLRSAIMVLRHDYQGMLDRKLTDMGLKNTSTHSLSTLGTPLIPLNYYSLVEAIGSELSIEFHEHCQELLYKSEMAKKRTVELAESIQKRASLWKGKPVVAAVHQKELCEWLGFEIAGVLERPEDTSPRDLEKLLSVKAEMVVANLQEGLQGANFLGERMNIPVAVLSNFPDVEGFGTDYYQLTEENMRRLEEAWQKR